VTRPIKRSFTISGHRTSLSLETPFWDVLKAIAAEQKVALAQLIAEIDASRGDAGLSSAVRIYVLKYLQGRVEPSKPPVS
jgi:predicted DNA-binding ribbon-helix-helix protein